MSKFKIGDMVSLRDGEPYSFSSLGSTIGIVEITTEDFFGVRTKRQSSIPSNLWFFTAKELEKVELE